MHPSLRLRHVPNASQAPRWLAAGLWLLAGLSASYWGARWWGDAEQASVPAPAVERVTVEREALARGLGASDASRAGGAEASDVPSRHALLGVVRDAGGRGAALIASDGQPPKPYRVGAALPDGLVLRELTPREALLGSAQGGITQRLSLPVKR